MGCFVQYPVFRVRRVVSESGAVYSTLFFGFGGLPRAGQRGDKLGRVFFFYVGSLCYSLRTLSLVWFGACGVVLYVSSYCRDPSMLCVGDFGFGKSGQMRS